jgi:hypothetical protein
MEGGARDPEVLGDVRAGLAVGLHLLRGGEVVRVVDCVWSIWCDEQTQAFCANHPSLTDIQSRTSSMRRVDAQAGTVGA